MASSRGSSNDVSDLRLLLIGRTGHGKSETGNSILGNKMFKASGRNSSVTKKCCREKNTVHGRTIEVVDTPGLFDTKLSMGEITMELQRSLMLCTPGFNAIALVFKKDRFTVEMKQTVDIFFEFFGDGVEKHAFIIFTHINNQRELKTFLDIHDHEAAEDSDSDDNDDESDWVVDSTLKIAIDKHKDRIDPKLKELIDKCGGNIVIINNKTKDKKMKEMQVQAILQEIESIKIRTKNEYFSNADFKMIEEMIEFEVEQQLQSTATGRKPLQWLSKDMREWTKNEEAKAKKKSEEYVASENRKREDQARRERQKAKEEMQKERRKMEEIVKEERRAYQDAIAKERENWERERNRERERERERERNREWERARERERERERECQNERDASCRTKERETKAQYEQQQYEENVRKRNEKEQREKDREREREREFQEMRRELILFNREQMKEKAENDDSFVARVLNGIKSFGSKVVSCGKTVIRGIVGLFS